MYNSVADKREKVSRSKLIDEQLKLDAEKEVDCRKIMLLGSGDSGKSTVLKQLKILYGQGFDNDTVTGYKTAIHDNILDSLRILVGAAKFDESFNPELLAFAEAIKCGQVKKDETGFLSPSLQSVISSLWQCAPIQEAYTRANEIQLQDTAAYFLANASKVLAKNFSPDTDDILRVRVSTKAISEHDFKIGDALFRMYDVGGQQSLRLFWAPYLAGSLQAIIFVSSCSSYDQVLIEDPEINRMRDSLQLYETLFQNKLLQGISIIIFLNKIDLLEQKISTSSVKKFFPEFDSVMGKPGSSDTDIKNVKTFFKKMFIDRQGAVNSTRDTYTHYTTSTDTKLMKVIISAVSDIIVRSTLQNSGLI